MPLASIALQNLSAAKKPENHIISRAYMGRSTTFYDQQFGKKDRDSYDPGEFDRNLVFVAMPFDGMEMGIAYSAIQDECKKLGLHSVRADEGTGSGFIIHEIKNLIERAEFIIFDLSGEHPNVYYELGYAHGVGNEAEDILLLAKDSTAIHFDTLPLRVNFYDSIEHLRSIVKLNLTKMINKTRY